MQNNTIDKVRLGSRVKNAWHKSNSSYSLKSWAKMSTDQDVKDWLNMKANPPKRRPRAKIQRKPKEDKKR